MILIFLLLKRTELTLLTSESTFDYYQPARRSWVLGSCSLRLRCVSGGRMTFSLVRMPRCRRVTSYSVRACASDLKETLCWSKGVRESCNPALPPNSARSPKSEASRGHGSAGGEAGAGGWCVFIPPCVRGRGFLPWRGGFVRASPHAGDSTPASPELPSTPRALSWSIFPCPCSHCLQICLPGKS